MTVLSDISVHQVGSEALDGVVELVAHGVVEQAFHCEVGPVGHLDAISVLVVVDEFETVL